jgi:hypothetical protein
LTRKWHSRHALMIARGARSGDYNRIDRVLRLTREGI